VQLWDNNAAVTDVYHAIYAPKAHPVRSANLGLGPRQKLQAFYVQLSNSGLLALSVPTAMVKPLIKKYKLKNGGQLVKMSLYLGVQLYKRGERVVFIKY
jgi:hypothetical protein